MSCTRPNAKEKLGISSAFATFLFFFTYFFCFYWFYAHSLEYSSSHFLAFFFSPSASLHLFDSFASKSGARREKPFAHITRG